MSGNTVTQFLAFLSRQMMNEPDKIIELEFTILEFYPDYVISRVREGQVLGGKQVTDLVEVCSEHYKGKKFVYLSYRINDYNVNPTVFLNLHHKKNIAGIGVISEKVSSLKMADFEKNFCKIPYEIFVDLNRALEWVEKVLKDKKADL